MKRRAWVSNTMSLAIALALISAGAFVALH
jgi:hypothetical protein